MRTDSSLVNTNNKDILAFLVPGYVYPGNLQGIDDGEWNWFNDLVRTYAGRVLTYCIFNPSNGPGTAVDPNYTTAIQRFIGAGGIPVAYIHTDYANETLDAVKAMIDTWKKLYPMVNCLFVDTVTYDDTQSNLIYYREIENYAKDRWGFDLVFMNPGARPNTGYFQAKIGDVQVVWESGQAYKEWPTREDLSGTFSGTTSIATLAAVIGSSSVDDRYHCEEDDRFYVCIQTATSKTLADTDYYEPRLGGWYDGSQAYEPRQRQAVLVHSAKTIDWDAVDKIAEHAGFLYVTEKYFAYKLTATDISNGWIYENAPINFTHYKVDGGGWTAVSAGTANHVVYAIASSAAGADEVLWDNPWDKFSEYLPEMYERFTAAKKGDITDLLDGVAERGDTMNKQLVLIEVLEAWKALMTDADADAIINTITEIIAAFEGIPEGDVLETLITKNVHQASPIGSIIGLHPSVDFAKSVDAQYYKYCDGSGTFNFTYSDDSQSGSISVPNLTDSRFLMGGTSLGTGGSNNLIDHTHSSGNQSANHTHSHDHGAISSGNQSASHTHSHNHGTITSGNQSASHNHDINRYLSGGGTLTMATNLATAVGTFTSNNQNQSHTHSTTIPNKSSGNQSASHTHSTTIPNKSSGNQSASHNHAIGSGSVATSTSNLPKYFKVKYYMRIK